jgi:hypothetical protein
MIISHRIYFYRPSYLVQKAVDMLYILHVTTGKLANMCRQQSTLVTDTGLTASVAIGIWNIFTLY